MQLDTKMAFTAPKPNVRIFNGLLEDLEADYRADVVLALHVLEHVDDPVSFLAAIGRRLTPTGFAIIEVPFENQDGCRIASGQCSSLDHKSFFSTWSLQQAVSQAGLVLDDINLDTHFHAGGRDSGIDFSPPAIGVIRAVVSLGAKSRPLEMNHYERYWQARTIDTWLESLGGSAALLMPDPLAIFVYRPGYLAICEFLVRAANCCAIFTTNEEILNIQLEGIIIQPVHKIFERKPSVLLCCESDAREQMREYCGNICEVV